MIETNSIGNELSYLLVNHYLKINDFIDKYMSDNQDRRSAYRDLFAYSYLVLHYDLTKNDPGGVERIAIDKFVLSDVFIQMSDMFDTVTEMKEYFDSYIELYEDDIWEMDEDNFLNQVTCGYIYDLPLADFEMNLLKNKIMKSSRSLLSDITRVVKHIA